MSDGHAPDPFLKGGPTRRTALAVLNRR